MGWRLEKERMENPRKEERKRETERSEEKRRVRIQCEDSGGIFQRDVSC